MDQSACYLQPPAHSPGKSAHQCVLEFEQIHGFQQVVDELIALRPRHAVQLRVNQHIFRGSELRVGSQRLRNHAHRVTHSIFVCDDVVARDSRSSGSWRRQRGHHANQSRLARAIWPEQAKNFALCDVEADVVDRHQISELLREMVHFNRVDGFQFHGVRAARTSSSPADAAREPLQSFP